jgi:AraC-like DNA-binding protein
MTTGSHTKFVVQVDGFINLVYLTLDEEANGRDLAANACMSRFHFHRLFARTLGEAPVAFRRRLLLERAAYQIGHTREAITEIAFGASYESLEGFSRAFRRAYGVSPSEYRRQRRTRYALACRSGLHFKPGEGRWCAADPRGAMTMDLTDRLVQHDAWLTHRLLVSAKTLTDEQLDRHLEGLRNPLPFEAEGDCLRSVLTRLVETKEIWVAAVEGLSMPDQAAATMDQLLSRLDLAGAAFANIVLRVRDEGRWDETFVDALCAPAETFTYGGMTAHVLTFSAYRRQVALKIMEEMGVTGLGYGDPIEWERQSEPATH